MKVKFFETHRIFTLGEDLENEINDFLEKNEIIDIKQSLGKDEYGSPYCFVMVLYK